MVIKKRIPVPLIRVAAVDYVLFPKLESEPTPASQSDDAAVVRGERERRIERWRRGRVISLTG